MFRATINVATALANTVVGVRFTRMPMISRRRVNSTRGIMAKGRPKLSMTWLKTSVRVGSRPMRITTSEGTIVVSRRTQVDTWRRINGGFLKDVRKQLLIWRLVDPEEKTKLHERAMQLLGQTTT